MPNDEAESPSRGREQAKDAQIVDRLIQDAAFQIENFTAQHCELAREAYARYGKGRNPAGLDYGDCFSYALAKTTGLPLLFKGEDLSKRTCWRCCPTLEAAPASNTSLR